jgi:hypothetical protein
MPRIRPAGGIILSNGSENEKTSNPYSRVWKFLTSLRKHFITSLSASLQ